MRNKSVKPQLIGAQRDTFWTAQQAGYASLCYLSNSDDWQEIISTIASRIAFGELANSLHLIDVGAGEGATVAALMKRLLTTYKRLSTASLIEPSAKARAASRLVFAPPDHGFGTADIFSEIYEVPAGKKADAILFIHTAYYIDALEVELEWLCANRLKSNGSIFFLVLGKTSPFFLGRNELWLKAQPEYITSVCRRIGLEVESSQLTSRITVPPGQWDDKQVVEDWQYLLGYHDWSRERFQRALRTYLTDGADLGDVLIVAHSDRG